MSYTTSYEYVDFRCVDCGYTAVNDVLKYSDRFYDLQKQDQAGGIRCERCQRKHDREESERHEAEENRKVDYDRYVLSRPSIYDYFGGGCSCHINPPCSYCTDKSDEEE